MTESLIENLKGYKRTDVGIIPEDWKVEKLGNSLLANPDYGINAAAVDYLDSLPVYIRITDITEDGKFSPDKLCSVNHLSSDNYYLEDGNIVFARTGASTGKTYLYNSEDGKLVFAGFLIRAKVNQNKLVPKFLKSYTETANYWNWVRIMSMRSGQPGINGVEYASLLIPLPPLPEQQAIAEVLSDVDALITSLDALLTKKRNIKQGTMQLLLTGKKRLPNFSGDWETKKLGEIATFINGRAYHISEWENSGVPVIRLQNLTGGSDFYYSNLNLPSKQYCNYGDLLFMWSATFGVHIWKGQKAIYHYHIWKIECKAIFIEEDFLYFKLDELTQGLKQTSTNGGTMLHVTKEIMESTKILIPPTIEEQKAIAQILSEMDAEIEALETRRDKYKAVKQGMMQELLTGKVRLILS